MLEFCKWIGVFTLIIERGFECGVKTKRQLFIFKLNDEASLSCSQAEPQRLLVNQHGVRKNLQQLGDINETPVSANK